MDCPTFNQVYKSLGGSSSSLSDSNCCSWDVTKIRCLNNRIQWIQLPSQSLNGQISPLIGNFSELVVLNVGQNPLTGSIPSTIGNLKKLYYFSIFDTQISGTIPPELGTISSLQFMDLTKSYVSGPIPASLVSRNISGNLDRCPYNTNMCLTGSRTPSSCSSVAFPNCSNFKTPVFPTASPTPTSNGIPNPFGMFNNGDVILAVICGLVLFLLAILGAVLVYYAKKRQAKQQQQRDSQATIPTADPASMAQYQSFYDTPNDQPQDQVYEDHHSNDATMRSVQVPQFFLDPNTNMYYVVSVPPTTTP